jgi:hypothetical protein
MATILWIVPILRHEREVAAIDGAIELRQGRYRFADVLGDLPPGNRRLDGLQR